MRSRPSVITRALVCLALTGLVFAVPSAVGSAPASRSALKGLGSLGRQIPLNNDAAGRLPKQQDVLEALATFGLTLGNTTGSSGTSQPIGVTEPDGATETPEASAGSTDDDPSEDVVDTVDPDGPEPVAGTNAGIWITVDEINRLPTVGRAWDQLKTVADAGLGDAAIRDKDSNHDVKTLAVALVYARTREPAYGTKARDAIMAALGTEAGGGALALARNLVSYVIAADLVGLSGTDDERFRSWLGQVIATRMSEGRSLRETHEQRPNNHGTHAGASRAATAAYLGDSSELARTAQVFKGYLGDRSSWSSFRFGSSSWQCDAGKPVGINPAGCMKDGHSVDGVLPDDQRRGGDFTWPPPPENYAYEALQGATVQAEILTRAGYPAWEWEDRALLRAFRWLNDQAGYAASGDDQWQPWLVNRRYGAAFSVSVPSRHGKNMGWTDWTHGF